MAAFSPEEFFGSEREWQWIKHDIFAGYTSTWLTILGSRHSKLHIVDAFAGAGRFINAEGNEVDGSPLITGGLVAGYNKKNESSGKSCDLLCIEKHPANAKTLASVMQRFSAFATVKEGAHQEHQQAILDFAGSDPLLLFLDPIGLKQIQAAEIAPLIQRTGKTDVFLTIDFQVVHRTVGMLDATGQAVEEVAVAKANAENLDRFFGSDEWRQVAGGATSSREQERKLLDIFFEHAVGTRYTYKNAYAVRRSASSPPKYWLAHLCDSEKGYLLMNDLIVKIDREVRERESRGAQSLPGLSREDEMQRLLEGAARELIEGNASGIAFSEIQKALLPRFFGIVKQGAYSKAVKNLLKANVCSRQQSGIRPKLLPDEIITPAQARL